MEKTKKLSYSGQTDFGRNVYEDNHHKYWVEEENQLYEYTDLEDFDFFPVGAKKIEEFVGKNFEIISHPENDLKLKQKYIDLSRMDSHLRYYLNVGNGDPTNLVNQNIYNHLSKMNEILNSFPQNKKPKWFPEEQMRDAEKAVTEFLKKRNYVNKKYIEEIHNFESGNTAVDEKYRLLCSSYLNGNVKNSILDGITNQETKKLLKNEFLIFAEKHHDKMRSDANKKFKEKQEKKKGEEMVR